MKATTTNDDKLALAKIDKCYIKIGGKQITFNNLPEISDQKGAAYSDEVVMGRTTPLKTYSHSETRVIGLKIHFIATQKNDLETNLSNLRLLESATYPGTKSDPYSPPVVCQIKCGKLLGDEELNVVVKSYNVSFPTDVPWDEKTLMPHKFDVDLSLDVVYAPSQLPGADKILK